ncbi:MAG: hypothetical protein ACRD3E_04440 [Terriglobales bacterium]
MKRRDYGDGMTADDMPAVIDRTSKERRRLLDAAKPEARKEANAVLALLPQAAALYRQQIALGLKGEPEAAAKARALLRELTGGIKIVREGRKAFAEYHSNRIALVDSVRLSGSGGEKRTRHPVDLTYEFIADPFAAVCVLHPGRFGPHRRCLSTRPRRPHVFPTC